MTPTPVDLSSYSAWKQESGEKIAAAGGGSRMSFSRRPVLDLPHARAVNDGITDSQSPGAEFEPVSQLDIPAFLRRNLV
jgi:hypothetical protein